MDQKKDVEQSREGSLEETKHFKSSTPGILFFRIFAWSCRVLSATQDSTCQKCSSKQVTTICQNMSVYHLAETNMPKHATTNMPNHVRIPPVKTKDTGIKHGSIPPEAKSKAIVAATAHAQITNALQCVTRSILCTKHAKSCQDTTCQHISRINRRHPYPDILFELLSDISISSDIPDIFWPFFLTHSFWTSCKHIFWHSIWLILWHLATTSLTHSFCNYYQSFPSQLRSGTPHWTHELAVGVRHATLNSHDRSWGPARHTELAGSQLRSGTPHWTHEITVGVRHATLNSQDRSWGPGRHTALAGSRLGSSTPHWTHRIAVGVQHATLNSQDRSWGGRQEEEEDEEKEEEEEVQCWHKIYQPSPDRWGIIKMNAWEPNNRTDWKGKIVWSKQPNHNFWGSNIHIFGPPNRQPNSYSLNIATEKMMEDFGALSFFKWSVFFGTFPSEPAVPSFFRAYNAWHILEV